MLRTDARPTPEGLERARLYEVFLNMHIHHVGNDSYYGKTFELEPWQRDNIWDPIFGCGQWRGERFVRQYSTAILCMPRIYGKTETAAAMMLTIANMELVHNGQYGIIASSEFQATKVMAALKAMVRLDPDLKALWEPLKGKLHNRETDAEIYVFPYSEEAVQSWHFNAIIADELHVWRDSRVWDAIQAGQKDIPNALCIGITTVGGDESGFLWDQLQKGPDSDPTTYVCWIGAPEKAPIDDERTWAEIALPSWVTVDSIRKQYAKISRRAFERYVLNRFPQTKELDHAINPASVKKCRRRAGEVDFTRHFSVGVDGAVSGDTLAICAFQRQGERDVFAEWSWSTPDEDGYYDFTEVADVLEMLGKKPGKPEIAMDPARMVLLLKFLERERGVKAFTLKQQPSIMCPASAMLTHSIEAGTACLKGTPVLADHAKNCLKDENKAYGFRFTSRGSGKSKRHIDMAIAAAMAMYVYENTEPEHRTYIGDQYVFEV